jgi:hypothetical protein
MKPYKILQEVCAGLRVTAANVILSIDVDPASVV